MKLGQLEGYFMKTLLPAIIMNTVFLALLLLCAGRCNYWPAWVYVGTSLLMSLLTRYVLRDNPELIKERNQPKPDAKAWDKRLLGLGFLLTLITLVIAGLDAGRWHLRPMLTWPSFALGLTLNLLGTGIFLRSLKENRFFSSMVRIQSDRGHTVCSTGPYRLVRHPGYVGMIVGTLGTPLLLMSAWSMLPTLLFVLVMFVRTQREDAVLQAELAGYVEYCSRTRYRLVPGIW